MDTRFETRSDSETTSYDREIHALGLDLSLAERKLLCEERKLEYELAAKRRRPLKFDADGNCI